MKSQQIAVYASLNDFMVAIGYQNASELREDDPVWSTLNQNNFKAMMEYKFGVEPRFSSTVPTKLEEVHEAILAHEAWAYREDMEHDDGEEAPVYVAPAPVTDDGAVSPEGDDDGEADGGEGDSKEPDSDEGDTEDKGEEPDDGQDPGVPAEGEPSPTEQNANGEQAEEPVEPEGDKEEGEASDEKEGDDAAQE